MLKQFSEESLSQPLTPEQLAQIERLMALRDEDIDTSEIPEVTELPAGAVQGLFYRGCPFT